MVVELLVLGNDCTEHYYTVVLRLQYQLLSSSKKFTIEDFSNDIHACIVLCIGVFNVKYPYSPKTSLWPERIALRYDGQGVWQIESNRGRPSCVRHRVVRITSASPVCRREDPCVFGDDSLSARTAEHCGLV